MTKSNTFNNHALQKFTAVVPAAGVGSRMQADRPKQYLYLGTKTVLEHTLDRLISHPQIYSIVLVVSAEDQYWQKLEIDNHDWLRIAFGGAERSDSVLNGIACVADDWVLVHDAARPCVRHNDISRLLKLADGESGGILARQATDTMKLSAPSTKDMDIKIQESIPRHLVWHALTPQFFPTTQLAEALHWCVQNSQTITDEASAIELTGGTAMLIPGKADNIKITNPGDLALAEFYLQQQIKEHEN